MFFITAMSELKRILIVDDSEYMREKIKRVLSPFDCEFYEAGDGGTALQLIEETIFDVIFLDLRFPFGVNGIDIFKKAKEIQPDLGNVIILTAWIDGSEISEAKALGVFDFLGKAPVDRKKITETFERALIKQAKI